MNKVWAISVSVLSCGGGAYAQSTQVTYTYDDLGRVTEVQYPDGSRLAYDYDAADNRNAVTLYDPSGQVVTTPTPTPAPRPQPDSIIFDLNGSSGGAGAVLLTAFTKHDRPVSRS